MELREQRQLLRKCNGEWDYQRVIKQLRLYSDFHHRFASHTGSPEHRGHEGSPLRHRAQQRHRSHEGSFPPRKIKVADVGSDIGKVVKGTGLDKEDFDEGKETEAPEESPVYGPYMADTEVLRCTGEPEVETESPSTVPDELARGMCRCEQVFWTQPVNTISYGYKKRIEQNRRVCDILKKGGPESFEEKGMRRETKNRTVCAACGQNGHWQEDFECPKAGVSLTQRSEVTHEFRIKAIGTKNDRSQGSKGKSESDNESHFLSPEKDTSTQPGKWRRIRCDEARRFRLQQSKKEAERCLAKEWEKEAKEWEKEAEYREEFISHVAMLQQLEREVEEDEEIYDQFARIYDFESDRSFDFGAAARHAPAALENGICDSGSSFQRHMKGTHHVEMHQHSLVMNEFTVDEDHVHESEYDVFLDRKVEHFTRKACGTFSVPEHAFKEPQNKQQMWFYFGFCGTSKHRV